MHGTHLDGAKSPAEIAPDPRREVSEEEARKVEQRHAGQDERMQFRR